MKLQHAKLTHSPLQLMHLSITAETSDRVPADVEMGCAIACGAVSLLLFHIVYLWFGDVVFPTVQ